MVVIAAAAVIALVVGGLRVRSNLIDHTPSDASVVRDTPADHLGEIAYQGDDYSKLLADGTFLVCDEEADQNEVRGTAEVLVGGAVEQVEVTDATGADGECLAVTLRGQPVGHWVCERNHLAWHCGNHQSAR